MAGVSVAVIGLVAAVGAGVAIGNREWPLVTVVVFACAWICAGLALGALPAAPFAVTAALPLYNHGPLTALAPGLGLLTVALLALLATVLVAARQALSVVVRDRRVWLLTTLAALVGLSAAVADDKASALSVARTHVGRGLALPVLILAVFAALDRTQQMRLSRNLWLAVTAAGLIGTVLAVSQLAWERGYLGLGSPESSIEQFVGLRAVGLSEHPNTWAEFALLPLAFAAVRWFDTRSVSWAVCTFALTVGIVLTGSRSGWIAVAAMTLVALGGLRSARLATGIAIGLVAVAAVALQFANFREFVGIGAGSERVHARLGMDESASFRLALARGEVELGLRNPLVGVGPGNIGQELERLHLDYVERRPDLSEGAPVDKHNAYWGLFAEIGAVGFALFVLVVAAAFLSVRRALRNAGTAGERTVVRPLVLALVATAVMGAFVDIDRHVFLWWLVGMAFALNSSIRSTSRA